MPAGKLDTRLVWLDRAGREVGSVDVPPGRWGLLVLSDDDRRLLVAKTEPGGGSGLWVVDVMRGVANRISRPDESPLIGCWSPDGREVLYGANRDGPRDVFRRAADGSTPDSPFYRSSVPFKDPFDWSPDGRWIVMQEIADETQWNLFLLPASGGDRVPFATSPANEQFGTVSPDGQWLLYVSDETGSSQAFVQSFPKPGKKQQVSRTGAVFGTWTDGGREIVLIRGDNSLVSVAVTPGEELGFGPPVEMFRMPPTIGGASVSSNGQRILVSMPAEPSIPGITVAVNWRAGHE
jgi:Tol biopolymer transport system component